MNWVIDASVAAKWLSPEAESAFADRLLDDELLVPDLLFPEVANVLWKRHTRREMDAAAVEAAARWLRALPLQVHDSAGLTAAALSLALRLQHPAYDCFYLALALKADCPLVTADRRLFDRCRRSDALGLVGESVLLGRAERADRGSSTRGENLIEAHRTSPRT